MDQERGRDVTGAPRVPSFADLKSNKKRNVPKMLDSFHLVVVTNELNACLSTNKFLRIREGPNFKI